MTINQHNSVKPAFSVPNWSEMCELVDVLTVLPLSPTRYTAGGIARILCKNSIYSYICIYIYMYIEILTFSIIIDIDRQHWKSCTAVATSEWHTVKICKHSHNRLIDNIGDYLYFKNQRMEASNLKLIHISSTWDCTTFHNFLPMFQKKKKIFKNWQVYDWRTKWLIMSGYMDLRRPRVYRRSNVGLVILPLVSLMNRLIVKLWGRLF